jgi:hypothetical protein
MDLLWQRADTTAEEAVAEQIVLLLVLALLIVFAQPAGFSPSRPQLVRSISILGIPD